MDKLETCNGFTLSNNTTFYTLQTPKYFVCCTGPGSKIAHQREKNRNLRHA